MLLKHLHTPTLQSHVLSAIRDKHLTATATLSFKVSFEQANRDIEREN